MEVHDETRDSSLLPFPCFRTNARFDGGMSGGPAFNENGDLCGIICSSIDPFVKTDGYVSYVSMLWPAMSIMIDAPWERFPEGTYYPVYDLALAQIIVAKSLACLQLRRNPDGARSISFQPISEIGAEALHAGTVVTADENQADRR